MADEKKAGLVKAKVIRERGVNHGDVHHEKGSVIELEPGQFADWESVGIVEAVSPKAKSDIGPGA